MIATLFDGFRIMDIEILAISLGIRSNLLIEGIDTNCCHLDSLYICFINR